MDKQSEHQHNVRNHSFLAAGDRETLRNSILEVFRQHLNSAQPGVSQKEDNLRTGRTQGMSGPKDRGQIEDTFQKIKKRHTRSERNKVKLRQQSKLSKKEDEFREQVKLAEEISSCAKATGNLLSTAITSDRLTIRLGLYNNARKSDAIRRGPLRLSENTKLKTAEEMKKIIACKETGLSEACSDKAIAMDMGSSSPVELDADEENLPRVCCVWRKEKSHQKPLQAKSKNRDECLVSQPRPTNCCTPFTPQSQERNVKSSSRPTSLDSDEFPEYLPMSQIAADLFGGLKTHKLFRDRNYYAEVKEDLYRLLKLSTNETPAPIMSGSVNSATVRRSVGSRSRETEEERELAISCHSMTKHLSMPSSDSQTQTSPSLASQHQSQDASATTTSAIVSSDRPAPTLQLHHVLGAARGQILPTGRQNSSECQNRMVGIREMMNAQKLLAHNDEASLRYPASSVPVAMVHNVVLDTTQPKEPRRSWPETCTKPSACRKRAVAEYIVSPNKYMPGFHDTYTGIDRETIWPHHLSSLSVCSAERDLESMDILEYIDEQDCNYSDQLTSRLSQASDSCTLHGSAAVLSRPPMESVSSPKFYPQKMF